MNDQSLEVQKDPGDGFYRVALREPLADRQLFVFDEALGIAAWVGTADGRAELDMLVFVPPKAEGAPQWTEALVRSWLNGNGFSDSRRLGADSGPLTGHDHAQIDGKANVRDDDADFWVIEGNVLSQTGAYNGILRTAPVLDKSWRLFEGVPITHPHPPGLVEDLDLVGGQVRNVRFETVSDALQGGSRIRGDYYLAKRSLPGLKVRDEVVALNEETVRRVRAGKPVDNSQGYQWRGRDRTKADPSPKDAGQDYEWVMQEQVPDHLAILLEQEGACPWTRGCGVARLPPSAAAEARQAVLEAALRGNPKGQVARDAVRNGDPPMAHDEATCPFAPRLKTAEGDLQKANDAAKERDHMRDGLARVGKLLGLATDGLTCAQVEAALKPRLDRLQEFEAVETTKRAALVKETVALALTVDPKAKKDELTAIFEKTPTDALTIQRDTLRPLAQARDRQRGDPGRFGGSDSADDEQQPRRKTVGVPTTRDGARVWA